MPTVLIADDEPLLREQLKSRLKKLWPELALVAEAGNGAEALALFEEYEPDVVRGLRDQADLKLKGRPETLTVSRNFTHLFKQM